MKDNVIVELADLFVYHHPILVLKNVNLTITEGEFVYLIGRTGTGKSSLMKTLYAEIPVLEGEAYVAGFYLHNLKMKQVPYLRRSIGIVFQDYQLLSDRTVYENLLFVLKATGWKDKKQMEEQIFWALEKVKLATKSYKMPHQLSGGEQQRVVIARALLNNPEIILADEPTGNLDPDTSREIMNLLFEIANSGRSVLMATHDYSLLKSFPARTLLCGGNMIVEVDPQNF